MTTSSSRPSHPDDERRHFLQLALGTGFALAVSPASATVITTDSQNLSTGPVGVPVKGEILPAYVARPANAKGALPVILVVQEIFGVHEHIQDLCRRLAKAGYLAIAPELYFRQGNPRDYPSTEELLAKLVSKVPDQQVLQDLDATLAWTRNHGGDSTHMAITGFCWGGRIVWLYAAHTTAIKAAAAWYGKLTAGSSAMTPKHPLDLADQLKVPVLGLYGGLDSGIPLDTVKAMQDKLAKAGSPSHLIIYPDAGHGFNADYRPSYNAAAARDGWAKMLAWFADHGVKP
ncbi:dienelactone hydrolase family protein [Pseudogulbenkiania subflava]|uniref:Carboxymethylenebutenolidase n=1 Tax=Pseudogulbenkiania subflava DSM 22618 TaxID=1123014 RepID=A0A1Y6BP77_9NEIS|nr:dienelactone hydrolase family protein [Pseudogulbenkiania subflava]SMF11207.1 carboxymethylenebutenolidase [Pseudogulbenkiania subflava DSM 22618]